MRPTRESAPLALTALGVGTVRLAVIAVLCGLLILLPVGGAHAQSFNPDGGAQKIFDLVGLCALLAGLLMGVGSLFARRVLAGLGFALAGGIIWVCCKNPEGTIGAAADWVMQQFT